MTGKITDGGEDDRVLEWEDGLPSIDDLTPLSQSLIPPELASAFRISPEPAKTIVDVNRASQKTFTSLREGQQLQFNEETRDNNEEIEGSESRKIRRRIDLDIDATTEEADSEWRNDNNIGDDNDQNDNNSSNKALKRPRLVWTPQLHKRFVDVVAHLGIKNAVPKTIMQLMNVDGLTRENVASHLQKYRLYLKRMQGLSNEGPSASDHLFASTPVPQSLQESGGGGGGSGNGRNNDNNNSNGHNGHMSMPQMMPMPMMYPPQMMPMPMMGMSGHGHGVHHHPYSMAQQRDWSGNKFGPYRHVGHNDK